MATRTDHSVIWCQQVAPRIEIALGTWLEYEFFATYGP